MRNFSFFIPLKSIIGGIVVLLFCTVKINAQKPEIYRDAKAVQLNSIVFDKEYYFEDIERNFGDHGGKLYGVDTTSFGVDFVIKYGDTPLDGFLGGRIENEGKVGCDYSYDANDPAFIDFCEQINTQDNGYAYSGRPQFVHFNLVIPLLEVNLTNSNNTMLCGDEKVELEVHPVNVEGLPPMDSVSNCSYLFQGARIEAGVMDDQDNEHWKDVSPFNSLSDPIIELNVDDIDCLFPDFDIRGREIKFRVKQPIEGIANAVWSNCLETDEDFFNTGRVPATSLPDYESKSINSIFFLEKPDLTIEPEQPDCHEGDNASVVIDNIPFAETSAGLRIDFIELLYDSNTNANEYEDSGFGWGGQVTDSFSIDPGQTSLELNKDSFDGNFNFTKGPYAVKAYYDTSLCSSDTVFEINAPDPLSLTIEPKTIDISDIYHTSKPGGTGSVKLTARGGRDSAKYEYWTSSNDDRVLFNKISKLDSVISIDSLSNNDSIFLSNTDSCEDTFDVVKFISPDPLQIEIDSANPPTCSSEDEGNSENGSITFSISGGISSYTITLYVKGDNGEYTPATDIDPPVSDNWDGLPEGIYMLKVSDRGGQTTDSSEINLIQAPIGATLADASPKLDCYEDEYTVEIDNTEDGYSFGYKNSSSSAYTPFTNNNLTLGGGDYDIQITEGDCYHVHDLSVKEPDEITIENINSSEATCSLQNGSLSFDVSGGWTDRNYVVTLRGTEIQGAMSDTIGVGEDKKVTFPDLPAGTDYAVEVTNGGKCSTLEENITVDKSNPLDAINISQTKDASCHAVHDATLKINNPDIIEGNFTIEIDRQEYSPNSNNEITGLAANKSAFFEIYETEGRECYHGEDIEIKIREDSLNFRSEIQIDSTSCGSASNGSISIGGMNGQGDYKYEMNNEGFTEAFSSQPHIFDGLANGIYFVSIRDEVGCVVSDSFTVESRSIYPISLSDEDIFVDSATCMTSEDGEIKLENIIHRDDLDLTVEYDDISKTIHTGGGVSYPKIGPGTYLFTIKDENGCSLKRDIDLGHNDINPVITNTRVLEEVACPGKTNGRFSIEMDRSDVFNYALYANEVSPTNVVSSDTVNEKSVFDIEGITNNPRYILEVEDPLGCYVSDTLEMPLLENPVSLSQVQTPASCDEINNGVLFLTADGGFPQNNRYVFHYDKQPRSGEAFQRDSLTEKLTIEGLSAGDYFEVSVQDKYGCKDEGDPLSIPLKENYTRIENVFPTHPACKGDSTGMLSTQMQWTPGTTDYEHWLMTLDEDFDVSDTLSQGAFHLDNLDFEELGAGRYELHVLDADGCSDNMSVELVDPDPVVVDVRHNYIRAKGDSTGHLGLSMHGGNQKYEVGWAALPEGDAWSYTDTFTESLFEVGGLKAGDYRVVVRDTANCPYFDGETWFSRDVSIIEPDEALNIETHEVTDASCNKYSDGRIEVMGSGGWGPDYRYSLNGGEWQPTGRFNGLTAGEYNVVVTDTAGVQFNLPLVVNEPDTLNLFVDSTRDATCPLYADGRVEATAINGIPGNDGLHYFIKDVDDRSLVYGDQHGGRDYQFYQLPKGDYELFVTDAHDCLASKPFRINEPDTAQIHIDHNFVRARGESTGRISALVEKGNGMFDYRWFINNNPYAFHADTTSGPIALDELDAGRYTLMVRDTAGCVYEESEWMVRRINIREPDTVLHFNIDENRAVSCFGDHDGRLRMKPAGGWGDYRYRLDDGAFVASPVFDSLSPGEYQLSVQDSAGIVYSAPATVSEPDPLQASLKGSRDVNCHGGADGAIMLEAEGGNLSYLVSHNGESWQKGTTIEGLPKGTFVPHVKDTLDCSLRLDSVEIKQPSRIRLVDSTIVKSRCSNNEGSIAASFEGGIGTFSYQWYKDTLDAGGDRQMVKLPGKRANEATRLFSGRYKAYVTDEHDCTVGFEFFVGDITDLSIDAIDTRDVWCWGNSDGEAEASVIKGNPPYEYTWTEEIGVAANAMAREIPAGKHGLMVTDAKGCKDYRDFIIGTPDSLFYDTLSFEDPLCLGGRKGHLEVAGTGGTPGYQYQWDNGVAGPEQVNLAPGTYTLTLTDAHDCRAEFDFGMDYQRVLRPDVGPDTLICHDEVLTLEGGDYDRFRWSNDEEILGNSSRLDVRSPGPYYLKVQDMDQCLGFDTLSLEVSSLEIEDLHTRAVSCANAGDGKAIVAVASNSNNYTVAWPDGPGGLEWSDLHGGHYEVSVNNPHGCSDSRDFDIYEPEPLALTTALRNPLCHGVPDGQLEVSASGGNGDYNYQWQHGPVNNKLRKLDKGTYTLDLSDAKGCHLSETYTLDYLRELNPRLGPDLSLCRGARAYISPGIFDDYNWFLDGQEIKADSVMEVIDEGEYVVEVSDVDDCLAYDSLQVDRWTSDVSPDFLTSSSVPLGDTLMLVDVTTPKPAGLEWAFSGDFEIVGEGEYFCEVVFANEGMHQVTLSALMEGCLGMARKQVLVTPEISDEFGADSGSSGSSSFFRSLVVSPNPANGAFSAEVEVKEAARVNLYLVRLETGQVVEHHRLSGLDFYRKNFNIGGAGKFVLFAECRGERMMKKVVVR